MTVMRDDVVKALAKIEIVGDSDGLIPAYGVLVNQLPVKFWNLFAERMMAAVPQDVQPQLEHDLVNCAYECGYHTGYGIINSTEFAAVVMPMVTEGPKDVLRGAFAVFTAWGWAKSGIVQLKEGERMTIRAQDYYEMDSAGSRPRAYMVRGVSTAFFELAFAEPYPNGMNTFQCAQTKGIEVGDPFGEFVITRKQ